MKHAFTMLELVFVIVLIGIISVLAIPKTDDSNLRQAADQLVSHIRYTQHLALMDNKFNPNEEEWYKRRWQIRFYQNITHSSKCTNDDMSDAFAYSIFSEEPNYTGNPDIIELAKNPENENELLSGGYNNILCIDNSQNNSDEHSMEELRLGDKYGITSLSLSAACSFSGSTRIAFDNVGRPLKGAFHNYTSSYPTSSRIITQPCDINITSGEDSILIRIEPETGYTHIL